MAVAPAAEISELLHFLVVVLHIIFDGEASGVVDADIATEVEEYPAGFECEEARVRSVDTITHVRLPSVLKCETEEREDPTDYASSHTAPTPSAARPSSRYPLPPSWSQYSVPAC